MTKEELKRVKRTVKAIKYNARHGIDIRTTLLNLGFWEVDSAKRVVELIKDNTQLMDGCRQLETGIEKCKEEIIKALKECPDYTWLPAHNGKAKHVYLQSVIDIIYEKFEELRK